MADIASRPRWCHSAFHHHLSTTNTTANANTTTTTIIAIINQLTRTACCMWVFPINQTSN